MICAHEWKYYSGCLGYESEKCARCGVDRADIRQAKYWYAPQLRPPAFGGMPRTPESLPEVQRMFPGQKFHAWAYAAALPADVVARFTLKLVESQEVGS